MEGNTIIAEYMQLMKFKNGMYDNPIKATLSLGLYYHTSWDWLMPVVEKIRSTAGVCINSDSKEKHFAFEIFGLNIVTPIETVYMYVINYIKWYNLNNK